MGVLASLGKLSSLRIQLIHSLIVEDVQGFSISHTHQKSLSSISGLVVEYIVAIDVTGVRFPADACSFCWPLQVWGAVQTSACKLLK